MFEKSWSSNKWSQRGSIVCKVVLKWHIIKHLNPKSHYDYHVTNLHLQEWQNDKKKPSYNGKKMGNDMNGDKGWWETQQKH